MFIDKSDKTEDIIKEGNKLIMENKIKQLQSSPQVPVQIKQKF